jgi:hypothetical protein
MRSTRRKTPQASCVTYEKAQSTRVRWRMSKCILKRFATQPLGLRWCFETTSSMYLKKLSLGGVILLLLFNTPGYCFKGDAQILTLKQKMKAISELHDEVSKKIDVITQLGQKLNDRKQTFIAEIIKEAKGRQVSGYKEAINVPRIHYNLKLIQKLEGYTIALHQKIAYLKDANEQLVFYYQQIEDDLKIIETLRDMDVDGLLLGINRALDAYMPETQKHIIYADQIEYYHPQEVWRKIMAGML